MKLKIGDEAYSIIDGQGFIHAIDGDLIMFMNEYGFITFYNLKGKFIRVELGSGKLSQSKSLNKILYKTKPRVIKK